MDPAIRLQMFQFLTSGGRRLGDLASWIHAPQRRFHRHEFFDLGIGKLVLPTGERLRLRDVGYGGVAVAAEGRDLRKLFTMNEPFQAKIRLLDREQEFTMTMRHFRETQSGFEFHNIDEHQHAFLASHISFMDAALFVRMADPATVFPAFRGNGWLNLSAHEGSIRFDIRAVDGGHEAVLVYSFDTQLKFCSWKDDQPQVGVLDGSELSGDSWRRTVRQVVSILVGLRQGAGLPDFGQVITSIAGLLDARPN